MANIVKTPYGFRLTMTGKCTVDDMNKYLADLKVNLDQSHGEFHLLEDLRGLQPLTNDARAILESGQKLAKQKGMKRSCALLNNGEVAAQLIGISKLIGTSATERYVNTTNRPGWEAIAENWLVNGAWS